MEVSEAHAQSAVDGQNSFHIDKQANSKGTTASNFKWAEAFAKNDLMCWFSVSYLWAREHPLQFQVKKRFLFQLLKPTSAD